MCVNFIFCLVPISYIEFGLVLNHHNTGKCHEYSQLLYCYHIAITKLDALEVIRGKTVTEKLIIERTHTSSSLREFI